MKDTYQPEVIEPRIQERWSDNRVFEVTEDPSREKYYCLSMLPYPSGKLHMGHVRNYTIGDVISRYQRMLGKNVLQPMGWDSFGLPAENAAIERKVAPADWTYRNIDTMRDQFKRLGYAYDWSREVTTCQPDYYRWEQLFFTQLFRKGLVYQQKAVVNWDPEDQTVLANEQVVDGRGWRSGALVERREITQWFIKITDYADELLAELTDDLEGWPDAVKTMQTNWIGRSEGLELSFEVAGHDEPLSVFTTRPDTLMGVTYLAVAPEHPLAIEAAGNSVELKKFLNDAKKLQASEAAMETMEKQGMPLDVHAIHPVTGDEVPIWVANFVLMGYGTGAVMAVPGHDQRDWEFATKYGLEIRQVIESEEDAGQDLATGALTGRGTLVNSGAPYDGMTSEQAFEALAEFFESRDRGQRKVNYRIRDWGVSRQRYWGCPIPMIHCGKCGAVPVPEAELPVVLPEDVEFMGVKSPIKADPEWRKTSCPSCGGAAERETDTFDTFVESSWYYARYTCPDADSILDDRANYWLPVDYYIGGIEHAVMHLLYFRFWHKLLRDAGMLTSDEPATRLLCQGMVVAETYYREAPGERREYFNPSQVEVERDDRGQITGARLKDDGEPVEVGRVEKMSKSKNNGVDPAQLIDRYGADTVRLFSMFAAPPDQSLEWSDSGVEGASRFLKRLWASIAEHVDQTRVEAAATSKGLTDEQAALRRQIHETLAKVADDLERRLTFNTAIAAIMELTNAVRKSDDSSDLGRAVAQEAWEMIVLMLSPIVPHIADELWRALGHDDLIDQRWPTVDESALVRDSVTVVVQVNGKLRSKLELPVKSTQDEAQALALADENVMRAMEGKTVRKAIWIPDRLINLVVG